MLATHLKGRSAGGQIRLAEPGVARRRAWRPMAGEFFDAEKTYSKGLGTFSWRLQGGLDHPNPTHAVLATTRPSPGTATSVGRPRAALFKVGYQLSEGG